MLRRDRSLKQKIHLLMKSGALIIDEARRVGSQLISDQLNGVAMPGRDMPTPSFVHRELNRAPAPEDSVDVHSVNPVSVEHDSQFLNEDARQIWDAGRTNMETETDAQKRHERWIMAFIVIACAAFMFVSVGMAFQARDVEDAADTGQQSLPVTPTPEPTPFAPILPRVGGN